MDDLSDINLDLLTKLSSLEELYDGADIDDDDLKEFTDDSSNMSRPSSTMSFASWSFSPISDDVKNEVLTDAESLGPEDKPREDCTFNNNIKNETTTTTNIENSHVTIDKSHVTQMTQNTMNQNIINFQQPINRHVINQPVHIVANQNQPCVLPVQQQQQQTGTGCDFIYPNSFTYNPSVNIYNYAAGPSFWRPNYVLDQPVICAPQRPDTPQQLRIGIPETLANLNTPGLELARCSTPEYLMALNSLHQIETPSTPSQRSPVNYNCSFLDNSGLVNNGRHDSGYISDIPESPSFHLPDYNVKLNNSKHTSTPFHPPQVVRMTNLPQMNKQHTGAMNFNGVPQQHSKMGYPTGHMNCNLKQMNPFLHSGGYIQSTFQKPEVDSVTKPVPQKKPEQKFKTMADLQMSKRCKTAPVKRKIQSNSETDTDSKRRRHNEPLSNKALKVLNDWYQSHAENPYPNKEEKEEIAQEGGLSMSQVKSWFANKRNRSHNTRPKKQKKEMEGRLLDICHQLARDASKPNKDNAYYIQQLSSILDTTKYM